MKRILLWAVALGSLVLFARVEPAGQNISSLQPVQVLVVSAENERIRLRTDTGEDAVEATVDAALEKLRAVSAGEVFLDTADYLLISDRNLITQIQPYLRPSCRVCLYEGELPMDKLGQYLKNHDPGVTLNDCAVQPAELPILQIEEGRMKLAF